VTARAEQAARTRGRIAEAALELFTERGYDGTSLNDVAERVGITKANVYYYFRTKSDLVAAVARPAYDLLGQALDEAESLPDPEQRMELLTERYVEMTLSRRSFVRLLSRDPAVERELSAKLNVNDLRERTLHVLYGSSWGVEHQLALFALNGFADAVLALPARDDVHVRPALLRAIRRLLDVPSSAADEA
jgi:AcrR family transcriptional regulator